MNIFLNGASRVLAEGATVADLLRELNIATKHVAVEINLEIVPRTRYDEHQLTSGDRLEVVTLVGGG